MRYAIMTHEGHAVINVISGSYTKEFLKAIGFPVIKSDTAQVGDYYDEVSKTFYKPQIAEEQEVPNASDNANV